jgi:uncharacterized membrane protein YeaQ/YmgE (transglycosylase-associated protein family)
MDPPRIPEIVGEVLLELPRNVPGYGLIGDLLLGVGGSMVGGLIFRTLGFAPNGGCMAMVGVAFVGAVILIDAQRMLWHIARLDSFASSDALFDGIHSTHRLE